MGPIANKSENSDTPLRGEEGNKKNDGRAKLTSRFSSRRMSSEDPCVSAYVLRISSQKATASFAGRTYLNKLIKVFRKSLEALEVKPSNRDLEKWACLIHECMSGNGRNFHSVGHVFDISVDAEPLQTLSAMFHDCIYYNVDGGLNFKMKEALKGVIVEDMSCGTCAVRLVDVDAQDDNLLSISVSIFGFKSHQTLLPFGGLNEFLSAMLACRELGNSLTLKQMVRIIVCIEATIPFRKPNDQGKNVSESLFDRLVLTNTKFDLEFTEEEAIYAIKMATDLGNRDVGNFTTDDKAYFLDNTWKLLPESNIPLRQTNIYTMFEYQLALNKMEGFFNFLDPTTVYHSFRGLPPPETMSFMKERVEMNIGAARCYLRAKLVGIAVLSSLAVMTGGDSPIAMFMGDLPDQVEDNSDFVNLGEILNRECPDPRRIGKYVELDEEIFNLLHVGRKNASKFDLKNSPLAAFLYALIGDKGIELSTKSVVYPMTVESARKFLQTLPPKAVATIAYLCAQFAETRSAELMDIAVEYSNAYDSTRYDWPAPDSENRLAPQDIRQKLNISRSI
mmetsp:Transcript_58976/g.70980  ORF Transcript_58976/g.70980 Transcript_58976/m.70980 type:complete len:562 (-) Transcript_58976:33-1718(-)